MIETVVAVAGIVFGFFSLTELGRPAASELWGLSVAVSFIISGAAFYRALANAE